MGLTIHYRLLSDRTDADAVRPLVLEFRRLAQQMPFQQVGEILEFQGAQCHHGDHEDPHRWLKIQAGHYLEDGPHFLRVVPLHILAFTALPGEGSEPANFGLARYPEIVVKEKNSRKERVATGLSGWNWRSFCKTQYASNPAYGGVANFVRCHLSVIGLLDAIKTRQLATVEVRDEGGYWDQRDLRKLAAGVGPWNEKIAAIAGQIQDAASGFRVQAPITELPNFEHLEAKGQEARDDKSLS